MTDIADSWVTRVMNKARVCLKRQPFKLRAAFPAEIRARDEVYAKAGALVIELSASELPAFCPNPSMPLWASHPRVFLDIVNERETMCPYCGTRYRLKRNTHVADHQFGTVNLHQHRTQYAAPFVTGLRRSTSTHTSCRETSNLAADAFGNTTFELMTRWLRTRR